MFGFNAKRPVKELSHKLELLIRGKLWLQVLIGLAAGLAVGIFLGPDFQWLPKEKSALITSWLALPGELFLRLITMVLVPLVATSIIRGLGGSTDIDTLKTVGAKFALFVFCTTTLACTLGLTIARIIQPGSYIKLPQAPEYSETVLNEDVLPAMKDVPMAIVDLIPRNPLASAIEGEMLGVVIAAIIVGLALAMHKNSAIKQLFTLVDGVLEVCMTIVRWALLLAPFAVFGLMARTASQVGIATLLGMIVYIATVLLGLFMLFGVYLVLVTVLARMSPLQFIRAITPVQLLAFSASSSAAVLPLSMRLAEEELNVDPKITKVVLPLGATVNMDGTALYQSVAILFLAQTVGIDFSFAQSFLVVITLVLASIGAPSTPGVGMIILSSVAGSFGVPTAALPLLLGVDRILDMSRTALNVTGDMTACVVLHRKK